VTHKFLEGNRLVAVEVEASHQLGDLVIGRFVAALMSRGRIDDAINGNTGDTEEKTGGRERETKRVSNCPGSTNTGKTCG
jgi:hypothetical protein